MSDFSPFPTKGCRANLRVRTVLRAILHDSASGQASSGLSGALASRPHGKSFLPAWAPLALCRKQRLLSQLAFVLWGGEGSRMLLFPPS